MTIAKLTCFHARIRLKREIKHASHSRRENDTLLIRCELKDGTVGWGESLPREYVTGENIASTFAQLQTSNLQKELSDCTSNIDSAISRLRSWRPATLESGQRDAFGNCTKAAVELAILDAVSKRDEISFSDIIARIPEVAEMRQSVDSVRYSAAVTSSTTWKQHLQTGLIHFYGFKQCKVKVGAAGIDDSRLLRLVRMWLGKKTDIRIDANEAWTCENLESKLNALQKFNLTSCEQPVPHADVSRLAKVKPNCCVPIMLDESLCSLSDADRAIADNTCDLFNVRISKCGGLIDSLLIAAKAVAANKGFQLGCQVGETGILSAVGRHFACGIQGIRYLEGSYDRLLVADQVTTKHFTFSYGGRAKSIDGPGHGAIVDEDKLAPLVRDKLQISF